MCFKKINSNISSKKWFILIKYSNAKYFILLIQKKSEYSRIFWDDES